MMIGQYFFLGATLRDVTSQSVRNHNKQSFIKRISLCTIYEDYYKFGFNFVSRYVGLIISLTYFYLFRAVLKFGHCKVYPEIYSHSGPPYLLK